MKQPDRVQKPLKARNAFSRAEKETRRKEAEERNAKYQALTPQQRIERLDQKLGIGVGAVRERARIAAAITAATVVKVPEQELSKSKKQKLNKKNRNPGQENVLAQESV